MLYLSKKLESIRQADIHQEEWKHSLFLLYRQTQPTLTELLSTRNPYDKIRFNGWFGQTFEMTQKVSTNISKATITIRLGLEEDSKSPLSPLMMIHCFGLTEQLPARAIHRYFLLSEHGTLEEIEQSGWPLKRSLPIPEDEMRDTMQLVTEAIAVVMNELHP